MDRNEALENYHLVKTAFYRSFNSPDAAELATRAGGAYAGSRGAKKGVEEARRVYGNLTEEDLKQIRKDSQGAGTGALRGFTYGAGGSLLGGLAGKVHGKGKAGALIGALAGGAAGAGKSYKESKGEVMRRAKKLSDRLNSRSRRG